MAYLEDKFKSLIKEILHLAESDRRYVSERERRWYGLFIGARPIARSPYAFWRRGSETEAPGDATAAS
jgi:hypothetical protein